MIDAVANCGTSCSILFFDVVAAFAQMLRRVVFNTDEGDEVRLASLAAAGFSDEDVKTICDGICNLDRLQSMLNDSGIDRNHSPIPFDFRYVEQSFSNSWVSQEYKPNVLPWLI